MASKKGIVVTVIILAAITGASFSLWLIEPENETTLVVTDYQNLREGKISPEDYITVTEVTSSQVTTQISEFITSKPSEQWQESYINYMEAMKKFNEYILETKVLANQIQNSSPNEEISQTIEKIESIKAESIQYIKKSNELRP